MIFGSKLFATGIFILLVLFFITPYSSDMPIKQESKDDLTFWDIILGGILILYIFAFACIIVGILLVIWGV